MLAERAGRLKDFSETTGFTVVQLQALEKAGAQVGVSAESVSKGLERFSVAMDDIKKGTGPAFESILEINPALALQLTRVNSLADGWDILSKAIKTADLEQANKLARAVFGRSGVEITRLSRSTVDAGGVAGAVAQLREVDRITEKQAEKWDDLGDKIAENMKQAKQNFAAIFAEPALSAMERASSGFAETSRVAKDFSMSDDLKKFLGFYGIVMGGMAAANPITGPIYWGAKGVSALSSALTPGAIDGEAGRGGYNRGTGTAAGTDAASKAAADAAAAATAQLEAQKRALAVSIAEQERWNSAMGAAVTPADTLKLSIDKLKLATLENKIGAEQAAKAQAVLTAQYNSTQFAAYIGLLGQSASVQDQVKAKLKQINDAGRQGVTLSKEQIATQLALTREQALGTGQIKAQIDATNVQAASMNMTAGAAAEFTARQTLLNEAVRNHKRLTAEDVAEIDRQAAALGKSVDNAERMKVASQISFQRRTQFLSQEDVQIAQQLRGSYSDIATALGSVEANAIRVSNATRELSDGFKDVGRTIVNAFLTGKDATSAMISALDSLANKLANSGFDNMLGGIVSGNPLQAGIGAAQMGVSWLITQFTGDQKAKQELEKAKAEWAAMTRQVTAFNLAAAGVDLGPLTNELNSLYDSASQLIQAAAKAQDQAGADRAGANFSKAVVRIVEEFETGTEKLTPLQQAIKEVSDEATGLAASLRDISPGWEGWAQRVEAALGPRIAKLLADYREDLVTGLQERLNDAQGKSYLNDAAALIKQHQQDLSDAALLGNDPALLGQIAAAFAAQAQKIIDDAGLVGEEFANFQDLFPDLAAAVHEAAVDISGSIANIKKYLESLQVGSNSILSPEQQLALAQENFYRQLGLAQGGDTEALGTITQYAQTLIDQAKSFYASSAGYADIFRAVTGALGELGGANSFSSVNTGLSSAASLPASGSALSLPVLTSASPTSGANDNGQYFSQQTRDLVQAQGAAATAIVDALHEEIGALRALIERQGSGGRRGLLPSERAARAAS
jgi:hypothetical protein